MFRRCLTRFNQLPLMFPTNWKTNIESVTALEKATCSLCGHESLFHNSAFLMKKRKLKGEKKPILYSPKPLKFEKTDDLIQIWKNMTVRELANAMNKEIDFVFEIFLYVDNSEYYDQPNTQIDDLKVIQDTVKKAGMRFTLSTQPMAPTEEKNFDVKKRPPAAQTNLIRRPPVVTIMGHVDHGKTTLLDALRHSAIVKGEFGGITQHIGAFSVKLDSGEQVTFLDTPGHAAFSAMRARGAFVTDLVVLVVAADDGVMEQTRESISHAMEAQVPIIVAINKIDKSNADVPRTREMLLQCGIQLEGEGGDVQAVAISALKGLNLDALVEAIVTQAELMDLRADFKGMVEAAVVESRLDQGRGKIATCIVQRGMLRKGASLVAGMCWCKVRNLFDENGKPILSAAPSTPVQVIGWRDLPSAGDEVLEVESEKRAEEVVQWRHEQKQKLKIAEDSKVIQSKLEDHLKEYKAQLQHKRKLGIRYKIRGKKLLVKEDDSTGPRVSVVLKGDVDGSIEAILNIFDTYHSSECQLDLISYGVGNVNENDVNMAAAFDGSIYTFNVEVPGQVRRLANIAKVAIKENNIIYRLMDQLKEEISEKLPCKPIEEILGEANVVMEFIITDGKKKIPVAGCRCVKGILRKDALYRIVRGETVVHEGKLEEMRHLKNIVNSIHKDRECGLRLDDHQVRYQPGDTFICYKINEVKQVTDWDVGF